MMSLMLLVVRILQSDRILCRSNMNDFINLMKETLGILNAFQTFTHVPMWAILSIHYRRYHPHLEFKIYLDRLNATANIKFIRCSHTVHDNTCQAPYQLALIVRTMMMRLIIHKLLISLLSLLYKVCAELSRVNYFI